MEKFNSILIVLPLLTILMFDLGLTLHFSDFVRLFKKPKSIIVGLFGQLVILPVIAFAIASILHLKEVYFIGLMLIACCPGGSSSNIFSRLAKGNVPLSVSLTAISSIITLFTLPVIMHFVTTSVGEAVGITLPVGNLLKQNFLTMLLPIILGILVRKFFEKAALAIDKVVSKCAFPALMLIAAIYIFQNRAPIAANFSTVGLGTTCLILVSIAVAAALSIVFCLHKSEKRTIVIEVGMQNAAQAISIAVSPFVFNNVAIATPAIVYALLMNVVLLIYVGVISLTKK